MKKKAKPRPARKASPMLKGLLRGLSEAFPAGMAPAGDKGAWVYIADYEKASRLLTRALKEAGVIA